MDWNPLHMVKDAAHAVVGEAKSTAHAFETVTNAGLDLVGLHFVSKVENQTISAVGHATVAGVSTAFGSIFGIATASADLMTANGFSQTSKDTFLSKDKNISVKKVCGITSNSSFDDFEKMLKSPDSGSLDLSGDIYNNQSTKQSHDQTHSYTNDNGDHVQVDVKPGEFSYRSQKNGKTDTQATQSNGISSIEHDSAFATLNVKNHILHLTEADVKLLQKPGKEEVIADGFKIDKDEAASRFQIFDIHGNLIETMDHSQLHLTKEAVTIANTTDTQQMQQMADQQNAQNQGQQLAIVASETGDVIFGKFKNGTVFKLSRGRNGNIEAEVQTSAGHDVILQDGKPELKVNGQLVPLKDAIKRNLVTRDELNDCGLMIEDIAQGIITVQDAGTTARININTGEVKTNDPTNGSHNVSVKQTDAGVAVQSNSKTVQTYGNGDVRTTTADGQQVIANMGVMQVRTPKVTVGLNETEIRAPGHEPITVKNDNTVIWNGGKGPVLHGDGSMKLDEKTSIDAHGNVKSGNWSASTGGSEAAARGGSSATEIATLEQKAQATANDATATAMAICAKAMSGHATAADISALNSTLDSISGLINSLNAAGASIAIPELSSAQASITDAIGTASSNLRSSKAA